MGDVLRLLGQAERRLHWHLYRLADDAGDLDLVAAFQGDHFGDDYFRRGRVAAAVGASDQYRGRCEQRDE